MKTLVTWTQLVEPSSAPGKTETGITNPVNYL